jgi:kumamolisin
MDSVAPGLDSIQIYENSGNAADVTRSMVLPLITPGAKPQVVSASLGLCEPYLVGAFGRGGLFALERDVELAAATGITVLASSGDQGSSACVDKQGIQPSLAVNYPASSRFVTAVGGTNFQLNADNSISDEIVWNDAELQLAAAGGGFSRYLSRPSYQAAVNPTHARVLPDVSMLADLAPGYTVFCTAGECTQNGHVPPWQTVGGTSAAAPLLAGGAALVDEDLHRHGKRFLGFMNPLLYAIGEQASALPQAPVYRDITAFGNDLGPWLPGHQALGCCGAAPGFDAASGWGSMNLANFDIWAQSLLPSAPDIAVAIPGGQHPLRQHGLRARVHCSGPCVGYAFAVVTYGNGGEFTVQASPHRFRRRGTAVLKIPFSGGQVARLRHSLVHHRPVFAEVFGIEDAGGEVAKFTAGRVTRIRS